MATFDLWLGFLAAEIILRCVERNLQSCPGCRDGIFSPILHLHYSLNLNQIIKKYMKPVITCIDIDSIFQIYLDKFGSEIEGDELIALGKHFMKALTPDALYYGNYVTVDNDFDIHNKIDDKQCIAPTYEPTPIKPSKTQTKKPTKKKQTTPDIPQ